MDVLQATKGISVFIPMLFIMTGIALCIGFQFVIVGLYRRRDPISLVFGLMSLIIALFIVNQIAVYQATTVADMAEALRHRVAGGCIFIPLFFAFVSLYTRWRARRWWLISLSALFGIFLVINLLSPFSIRLSEISQIKQVSLPWGETLNMYSGTPGKWNSFYVGVILSVFMWAVGRAVVMLRTGERRRGWLLGAYCALQLSAVVYDGIFIDGLGFTSFYITEFFYFGLVLIMSVHIGSEVQWRTIASENAIRELHEEITARRLVEEEKQKLIHDLGERVKELTMLHYMAGILHDEMKSVPELLQEMVALLPPAWQYPEITAGRINFAEMEFKTANFAPTQWSQTAEFLVGDLKGTIEVVYLEACPAHDIGPFLLEEKNLINSLAEMLSSTLRRRSVEEENRKLIHDLGERVKELTMLHYMAGILHDEMKSVPELLQEMVALLPPAWQYPEITAGRINFAEMEFKTANFAPTQWSQTAEFLVGDLKGTIEVVYLEACPAHDIGPFLLEEKNLINSLAEMLSSALSRRSAQEALRLSEERFAKAFQASPEPISIYRHRDSSLLEVNERWTAIYGYSREEAVGHTSLELNMVTLEVRDRLRHILREQGSFRDFEIEFKTKQGEIRQINLSGEQIIINNESCDIYLHRDVTERKQAEERINLLQMMTMDVATAKDLPSALEVVLQRVCEKTGWALGQAWVPKQDGTALDCCPAWFATTASLEEFRAFSRNITFPSGIGLPGRVWASRQPLWVRDVTLDTNFPRAEVASRGGLKAGLGVPILAGDEVIAILEFFLHEPRDEDERLVKVIAAVAMQIGLVIERKRAEEELRRASERLQLATRAASIGIWDWDVVKDELIWDDAMYHLYGVRKEDFSGAYDAWAKSLAPEDFEWANAEVQAALRGEREFAPEFRIVWPDDSIHFTKAASQTFRDEEGRPIRMVGVNYDVTERKLAEEALRESQRRFSDTLANLEMIAVMADVKGNITFCNDYLLRLTGWEREEAIGRNWFEMFIPEQEKERVSDILEEIPQEGSVTPHFENEIKTRSGERRLVKWTNTTLRDLDGHFLGVAALGDDITERKQAEEQLLASREQLRALSERLRRAKEEEGIRIAREIHDELGSALTSLKWSLLRFDKVYSATGNSVAHASERKEIEEMVGLVDATINTVRRIASELRPGVLDDLGLVSAIEWHAQQYQEHTAIVCRFDSSIDHVDLDREQATTIFRIFQEAMTNILRHAQATKVNLLIEEEEGEFVLEIRDNGRGITESEKSGTRSLGLLGMRERAHSVGGRIEMNGIAGKGTVLIVRLPIQGESTF